LLTGSYFVACHVNLSIPLIYCRVITNMFHVLKNTKWSQTQNFMFLHYVESYIHVTKWRVHLTTPTVLYMQSTKQFPAGAKKSQNEKWITTQTFF
jgi:hypothetical protein